MAVGQWMKLLGTVTTLAQVGAQFRRPAADLAQGGSSLEHRLAGVVVAALKEAFDRDRARMDLERETLEAERSRAERALQAELRRQAADRALMQIKLISVFAGLALLVSGVLAAWIGGMRTGAAAVLLIARLGDVGRDAGLCVCGVAAGDRLGERDRAAPCRQLRARRHRPLAAARIIGAARRESAARRGRF